MIEILIVIMDITDRVLDKIEKEVLKINSFVL